MPLLPNRIISNAGVIMPPIIYGTAWKKERTSVCVQQALAAGFRGIDTACQPKHYDEPLVGKALLAVREQGVGRADLYLQTKFTPLSGQDPLRIPYDLDAPLAQQVEQSFACSLDNLNTDYLDGYILHSPLGEYEQTLVAWRAMEHFVLQKSVRQLGISNCYNLKVLQALYRDAKVKPALVQNRFYKDSGYDKSLREWCRTQGIIYQSFWTLTANPHLLKDDVIQQLAITHGRTPAQILFCYLSLQGVIPLTGTTSQQHMREDLQSFDLQLSDSALAEITALLD